MDTLNLKSPGMNGNDAGTSSESSNFSRAGGSQMQQFQMQPSTPRPSISAVNNTFQSQQLPSKQPQTSSFTGNGGGSFTNHSNGSAQQEQDNAGGFSAENLSAGDQNNNNSGSSLNSLGPANLSLLSLPTVLHFIQSEWARFDMERNQWEALQAEMEARIALLQGERTSLDKLKNDLVRRIKMLECALRQERIKNVRLLKQSDVLKNANTGTGNVAVGDVAGSRDDANSDNNNDEDMQLLRMSENVRISRIPTPSAAINVLIQQQQQQQQQQNQSANVVNASSMSGGGITNNNVSDNNNKGWDFKEGRWAIQQYLKELNYTDNIINIRTARLKSLCGGVDGGVMQSNGLINGQQQQAQFFTNNNQHPQQQYQQQQQQQQQLRSDVAQAGDKNTNASQNSSSAHNTAAADSQQNVDENDNDADTNAALREFEFLSESDANNNGYGATNPQQQADTTNFNGVAGVGWRPIDAQQLDNMKQEYIQHRLAQHHQQQGAVTKPKQHGPHGNRRETLVNRGGAMGSMMTGDGSDSNSEEVDGESSSDANNSGTTSSLQQAFKISIGHVGDRGGASSAANNSNKSSSSFGNVDHQASSSFNNNNHSMQTESLLQSPVSPNVPATGVGQPVAGGSLIAIDMEDDDENDGTDNVFDVADGGIGAEPGYGSGLRGRSKRGGRQSDAGSLTSSGGGGAGNASERRVKWRGLYALSDHVDVCRAVCFHPNDLSFASCSDDCTVKIWTLWSAAAGSGSVDATMTPSSNRKGLVPYTTLADAKERQLSKSSADGGTSAAKSDVASLMGTSALLSLMPDRHADFGPYVTLKLHRYPVIACVYAVSSASSALPSSPDDVDISSAVSAAAEYNLLFTADISGNIRAWNLDRLLPPSSQQQQQQAVCVQKDGASNDNVVDLQHVQAVEMPEIHTDAVWTLLYVPPMMMPNDKQPMASDTTTRRNRSGKLISVDCQSQLVIWSIKTTGSGANQVISIEVSKQYNIRDSIHAVDVNGIAAPEAANDADNNTEAAGVENDISMSKTHQHQLLLTDELVGVVAADERCEQVLACFRSSGCYIVNTQTGELVRQLKLIFGETSSSSTAPVNGGDAEIDHNWDILSCASHPATQLAALGHRNGKVTAIFLGDGNEINTDAASTTASPTSIVRAQWQAQLQDVVALAFDRNGERLLTGASDGAIRLWSTIRWHCIQDIKESRPKFNEAITTVCIHAQQPMLASGSADGVVRIYTPF